MALVDLILIGGGGHCKSCIDVIERENRFNIVGIIDLPENIGKYILGYPIIGSDQDLDKLSITCDYFFITIGQLRSAATRVRLFNKVKSLNKYLPVIISPSAYVSKHSVIKEGTIVMHDALVNAFSNVGENSIINTKAVIEHDTSIGNNCHISTMAIVNGQVNIGDCCTIGSNSSIIHNISIIANVIVGMGAVVVQNIRAEGTYVGIPAKKILG